MLHSALVADVFYLAMQPGSVNISLFPSRFFFAHSLCANLKASLPLLLAGIHYIKYIESFRQFARNPWEREKRGQLNPFTPHPRTKKCIKYTHSNAAAAALLHAGSPNLLS